MKYMTVNNILRNKIAVVVRGDSFEEGIKCSEACIKGGLKTIEVAYTNKNASDIISNLSDRYNNDVLIGAGTVLDSETARLAILSGAMFIVSPSFNVETAKLCNRYQVPYIPGCMTINEILKAMESGCEILKVFPGGVLGADFIKSLKAPLPQALVMVTGGVNIDNYQTWISKGADAIGIGGEFNKLSSKGKFEEIEELAKRYSENII